MTIDEAINALNNAKAAGANGGYEIKILEDGVEKDPVELRFVRADVIFYPGQVNEANRIVITV